MRTIKRDPYYVVTARRALGETEYVGWLASNPIKADAFRLRVQRLYPHLSFDQQIARFVQAVESAIRHEKRGRTL